MKTGILFLALVLQIAQAQASNSAFPPADQMKANFETCNANVPNWMQNWGRYNVAFDVYTAHNICSQNGSASNCYAKALTCGSFTHTLFAGFYCACR